MSASKGDRATVRQMFRVQQIIHSLEEGKWAGRIRALVLLLLLMMCIKKQ